MFLEREQILAGTNPSGSTDVELSVKKHGKQWPKLRDLSTRFTKSTTSSNLDSSLCPHCRVIDFAAVFETADAGEDLDGVVIAKVGFGPEGFSHKHCRLCNFMSSLRDANTIGYTHRYDSWKLCTFDGLTVKGFLRSKARESVPRSVVLALLPQPFGWFRDTGHIILPINWPRSPVQAFDHFGYRTRPLSSSSINYKLIQEWLRDCEDKHQHCRLDSPKKKPIKLIDCLYRTVIPSTPNMEYLALSYVWGDQATGSTIPGVHAQAEGSPDGVPKTLADAMDLVLLLKLRYLWIDRWCINQADKEEKHHEILRMDDIYEGAFGTIVAAASTGAHAGLAGLSAPRYTSPHVNISGEASLLALSSLENSLMKGEWNRRGWTYQEFCLSRRCLILAEDQVHFICRTGRTSEAIEEAPLSNLPFRKQGALDPEVLKGLHFHNATQVSLLPEPIFARHLHSYIRRALSYESDMLNAFRGILRRSTLVSYWGVPVFRPSRLSTSWNPTAQVKQIAFHQGFAFGLCWMTEVSEFLYAVDAKERFTKREGFPSWSWVSNPGVIRYRDNLLLREHDDLRFNSTMVQTCARFFCDDPTLSHCESISDAANNHGENSKMISERSPAIYVRSFVKDYIDADTEELIGCYLDNGDLGITWHPELNWRLGLLNWRLILLLRFLPSSNSIFSWRWYMIVTMDGNIAHRVGLAHTKTPRYQTLETDEEEDTIKVI